MAKSASQFAFATVPSVSIPRSSFNRSSTHKTCINTDYLYPIFCDEVLPGDTFNLNMTAFGRLNTLIRPIMDNLYLDFHFFYVPNRLVWENWNRMLGERDDPDTDIDVSCPMINSGNGFAAGSIYDYLGLPVGVPNIKVSALPLRAINLIYNDHYRDENLIDRLPVPRGDEYDDPSTYSLFKRGKRHDYFTSCLTSPQKGEASSISLGNSAAVYGDESSSPLGIPKALTITDGTHYGSLSQYAANSAKIGTYVEQVGSASSIGNMTNSVGLGVPSKTQCVANNLDTGLIADLSEASAVTVNQLREAFAIQRLLERDARSGTRINELIYSHFSVIVPDYRVQRSEYLGGGSIPVNVHTIAQTSATSSNSTPQGNLTANGTVAGSAGFSKSFVEHGFVIGFANLRADLNYQQGLQRMWSRETRYDWYWPALSHLGEQVVYNREIYAQGDEHDSLPFGFQERWAEYRYSINKITSVLRSSHPQSLDSWHLAQDFEALPTLSREFIEESVPIDRVLAVGSTADTPALLLDMLFNLNCVRPLPTYSVPGLMDHF